MTIPIVENPQKEKPNPRSKPKSQKTRHLIVRDIGDRYRKQVCLQVRLQGKWLLQAGLIPDRHVEITNPHEGMIVIRCL
jgi:hypothetical protein